ncbi:hypothetical protein LuPra_01152 [Luteitalea pratensis]|uniref:Transporter n=1 Tax=Luteitalea pratensis TaxID=1855912 RepID=A0A143PHF1_LUTPR|nr:hypothetical protein LuPra_01152 [Luteitalea pratensis]
MKASLTFVSAFLVLAAAGAARAQAPTSPDDGIEMPADRPGFNAPASVVGAGVVQLELGWSTSRSRDRTYASAGPQPLFRVGVATHVELQLASVGLAAACVLDCDWHGADVSASVRVVLPVEPLGFTLAATPGVSLPTGAFEVSSEHVDPLVIIQADHGLGAYLELSYNYLVTRIRDDDPDRAVVRQGHGFSLGATLGRWSPFVGLAWRPERVDGRAPCLAQVGTGVRVARDVQLDVSLDRGLNRVEESWGISAGVALRHRPR